MAGDAVAAHPAADHHHRPGPGRDGDRDAAVPAAGSATDRIGQQDVGRRARHPRGPRLQLPVAGRGLHRPGWGFAGNCGAARCAGHQGDRPGRWHGDAHPAPGQRQHRVGQAPLRAAPASARAGHTAGRRRGGPRLCQPAGGQSRQRWSTGRHLPVRARGLGRSGIRLQTPHGGCTPELGADDTGLVAAGGARSGAVHPVPASHSAADPGAGPIRQHAGPGTGRNLAAALGQPGSAGTGAHAQLVIARTGPAHGRDPAAPLTHAGHPGHRGRRHRRRRCPRSHHQRQPCRRAHVRPRGQRTAEQPAERSPARHGRAAAEPDHGRRHAEPQHPEPRGSGRDRRNPAWRHPFPGRGAAGRDRKRR